MCSRPGKKVRSGETEQVGDKPAVTGVNGHVAGCRRRSDFLYQVAGGSLSGAVSACGGDLDGIPGAVEEVENMVTRPIEEAISTLGNLKDLL